MREVERPTRPCPVAVRVQDVSAGGGTARGRRRRRRLDGLTEVAGTAVLLVGAVRGPRSSAAPAWTSCPVTTAVDGVGRTVPARDGEVDEVLGGSGSMFDDAGPTIVRLGGAVVAEDLLSPLHAAAARPSSATSGSYRLGQHRSHYGGMFMKARGALGAFAISWMVLTAIVLPTVAVHAASVIFVVNSTADADDAAVNGDLPDDDRRRVHTARRAHRGQRRGQRSARSSSSPYLAAGVEADPRGEPLAADRQHTTASRSTASASREPRPTPTRSSTTPSASIELVGTRAQRDRRARSSSARTTWHAAWSSTGSSATCA